MQQGALSSLAQYSAPLRRFGAWLPARYLVLAIGLVAMTAFTVPELRSAAGIWLPRLPVVLSRLFCRRKRGAPAGGVGRRNRPGSMFFRCRVSSILLGIAAGSDRACLRRGAADRLAVRLVVGAQARPGFARLCPAWPRVRARSEAAGQRPGAVPDRAVSCLGRHACASSATTSRRPSARCRRRCGGRW